MKLSPEQRETIETIRSNAGWTPGGLWLPKRTLAWMCEALLAADRDEEAPFLVRVLRDERAEAAFVEQQRRFDDADHWERRQR